ncbi:DUF1569 domain-containing protein [Aquimarina aquimarini]|uniref:DUF1569 domain-containing protein n=1 Tax=Aquimarina aquimarini TaxID=1191734 RepID=UPI000D55851C|nr:DUF1569 domain-containing protein [Aquimarina aquimarini]
MDILNYQEVKTSIQKLTTSTPRKFGKMTPQHVIEHLTFALMFSNGEMPQKLIVSVESARKTKEYFVKQNNEFEPGFKTPLLGDEPPEYVFENLEVAKEKLLKAIIGFKEYFKVYPKEKPINPIMGHLDREEWIILHNKHFKHHFYQYGIEI